MESKFKYQMNALNPFGAVKGGLDLEANTDAFDGMVDKSQATPLVAGDPVAIKADSLGLPHFVKATVGSVVMGFVKWSAKQSEYKAGDMVSVSNANDVMYMEAGAAIDAGVAVNISDLAHSKIAKAGASKSILGYSLEKAAADGELVRVRIVAPVALTANA